MTTRLTAARPIPTMDVAGSTTVSDRRAFEADVGRESEERERDDAHGHVLALVRIRGTRNCHATAAADSTSTMLSRPNPISAAEEAATLAPMATTAFEQVVGDRCGDDEPHAPLQPPDALARQDLGRAHPPPRGGSRHHTPGHTRPRA
jgi:hypothetical protein